MLKRKPKADQKRTPRKTKPSQRPLTGPELDRKWQPGLLGFQNQEGLNALGGTYTCSRRNIAIQGQ